MLVYEMRGFTNGVVDNRLDRMAKGAVRQFSGRFLRLVGEADEVAKSGGANSQPIKNRVAGFSETNTVLTPASELSIPVSGLSVIDLVFALGVCMPVCISVLDTVATATGQVVSPGT